MDTNEIMNRELARVHQQLASCTERIGVPSLRAAAAHLLGLGKLYRPRLLLATCLAFGREYDVRHAAPAAAVEILHTSTLIHDDLPSLDDAQLRRGEAAVHRKYGEAAAILAGDVLLNMAFGCILESEASSQLKLDLLRSLSQAAVSVMEGQALDVARPSRPLAIDEMMRLYEKKTGALLGACCEMGAILFGAPDPQKKRLQQIGVAIGVGFQVRDDLLAVTSTEEQTGKTLSADLAKGKSTAPDILGVEGAEAFAENILRDTRQMIEELELQRPAVLLDLAQLAVKRDR